MFGFNNVITEFTHVKFVPVSEVYKPQTDMVRTRETHYFLDIGIGNRTVFTFTLRPL